MLLPRWLIKLGFYLLYNHMAFTYDIIAWLVSFGQWAAWRRLALRYLQPGPILELAYGTGGLFVDMSSTGLQPIGIDISPYMAQLASRRLRQQGLPAPLCRAKAQNLPFPDNHFSNIIATFPTNYIFEPETVAEIHRLLKDDVPGRLIVVIEGQLRGPWPIRPFIDWLYRVTDQRDFPPRKTMPIFAEYDLVTSWHTAEENGAAARLLIVEKRWPSSQLA
ncbi:MAG: class I SAM-dependent methyltransferase [Anaerolineae bacterium]|nr:class I SAM-dependent methyltransferase [Anaerolineae bacterium]